MLPILLTDLITGLHNTAFCQKEGRSSVEEATANIGILYAITTTTHNTPPPQPQQDMRRLYGLVYTSGSG